VTIRPVRTYYEPEKVTQREGEHFAGDIAVTQKITGSFTRESDGSQRDGRERDFLTRDPRFVLAKPAIAHFAIGAIMLCWLSPCNIFAFRTLVTRRVRATHAAAGS
jgi:hypothetical protein